ncbi:MAG: hypothetical protein IJF32_09505 [Oscillospiraceae bacterium]|nr:hypothetical protein [Oscillospiraceae bacterium]
MKKLFAIILALSMIAAMLPAGTAFAADENGNLTYVFGASAYGKSSGNQVFNVTDTLKEQIGNIDGGDKSNTKTGSDKWKMWYRLGGAATQSVTAHANGFIYFATTSDSSTAAEDDVHKNALVLQLVDVPEGVYVPALENPLDNKQTCYGVTDLYLVSEETRSKNKWNVKTIDGIDTILSSAEKLESQNWSASVDVMHLSSVNYVKNATDGTDFNKIAPKIDIDYADEETTKGNWWLIATVSSKPSEWIENTSFPTQVFGSFGKLTLTREADDTELTSAFTAEEVEHSKADKNVYGYKSTDTANAIVEQKAVTTDTVTVSTTDTENFLYWAQGLTNEKKILSFSPSFDYTPSEGNNYLVAVYRDTANKAEFFNANGQREAVLLADGTAPALPERVGYEPATAWVDLDGNTVAPGETVTVSGYNSYVPNYGERISVTVNSTPYNYGEPVTLNCTDVAYYEEGKYFKGWKKDNAIVSTSESYSFLAYKNTIVTAEWVDAPFNFSGNGRKIVLDLFNNALMAEFIGFGDNVVEKGIMFTGTTKTGNIAMTTDSNQLVIIPDKEGTYKGYAIIEDSDGTQTLVTDGEYIKAAE